MSLHIGPGGVLGVIEFSRIDQRLNVHEYLRGK
jgi:hypothetical protein